MGVGKTTVCNQLHKLLKPSVLLDGDWCWQMNPFIVSQETMDMVEDNISYLLNNFLNCSEFEYVIFCWVMHHQEMITKLLEALNTDNHQVYCYSLVCSEQALAQRLKRDVADGLRKSDIIEKSLPRLGLYNDMETTKVDVSHIDYKEAARIIMEKVGA